MLGAEYCLGSQLSEQVLHLVLTEVRVGEGELVLGGRHHWRRSHQLLEVILVLQRLVESEGSVVEVFDHSLELLSFVLEFLTHSVDSQ